MEKFFLNIFKKFKTLTEKIRYFRYDKTYFENEQNLIFQKVKLDRLKGLEKLKIVSDKFNNENYGMNSEHLVLFSSISLKKKITNILEIGTFDGINSSYLSKFFTDAKIDTIDLDESDEKFNTMYNREINQNRENNLKKRNQIIDSEKRINFIKMNSLLLSKSFEKDKYDLIWIDGHHGNPFVTIDILNSLRLIKDEGIILSDDILLDSSLNSYDPYESNAAFFALKELKQSGLIDYQLIYKRLDKFYNSIPSKRKYIGIIKKIKNSI